MKYFVVTPTTIQKLPNMVDVYGEDIHVLVLYEPEEHMFVSDVANLMKMNCHVRFTCVRSYNAKLLYIGGLLSKCECHILDDSLRDDVADVLDMDGFVSLFGEMSCESSKNDVGEQTDGCGHDEVDQKVDTEQEDEQQEDEQQEDEQQEDEQQEDEQQEDEQQEDESDLEQYGNNWYDENESEESEETDSDELEQGLPIDSQEQKIKDGVRFLNMIEFSPEELGYAYGDGVYGADVLTLLRSNGWNEWTKDSVLRFQFGRALLDAIQGHLQDVMAFLHETK